MHFISVSGVLRGETLEGKRKEARSDRVGYLVTRIVLSGRPEIPVDLPRSFTSGLNPLPPFSSCKFPRGGGGLRRLCR